MCVEKLSMGSKESGTIHMNYLSLIEALFVNKFDSLLLHQTT